MNVGFTKMHGAGNDFIIINGMEYDINNLNKFAKLICDRHFKVGGDGLIIILPAENKENDFRMRIFNADGTEAEMCGNGIRCFAHYLYNKGLSNKKSNRIETLAGIIIPQIISETSNQLQVKVNMGKPEFKAEKIPVYNNEGLDYIDNYLLKLDEYKFYINCVSMGNPHTIIFIDDDLDSIPLSKWGPEIENHPMFPEKTNVEFVNILAGNEINMRVWERGSGITLACGTGACASVVTGIRKSLLNNMVTVHLKGGDLLIEWTGNNVFMTGPSQIVFNGEIEL
jgi:diaminopimelate epimerase